MAFGREIHDRVGPVFVQQPAHERIVAFVHIGTQKESAPERTRPALRDVVGELRL